jgi:hypothetical protein
MYPEGPVSQGQVGPQDDPIRHLAWFDAGNYQVQVQPRMRNLWVQGGAARAGLLRRRTPRARRR